MDKTYKPTRCSNKECAYPFQVCSKCPCNSTQLGKRAQSVKDPKGIYDWIWLVANK